MRRRVVAGVDSSLWHLAALLPGGGSLSPAELLGAVRQRSHAVRLPQELAHGPAALRRPRVQALPALLPISLPAHGQAGPPRPGSTPSANLWHSGRPTAVGYGARLRAPRRRRSVVREDSKRHGAALTQARAEPWRAGIANGDVLLAILTRQRRPLTPTRPTSIKTAERSSSRPSDRQPAR